MTKLSLSYAGYANHCTGQLGGPSYARPISLMDGVLGFFARGESRLVCFHIERFQGFGNWEGLRKLLGEEVTDKIYELHQQVYALELPRLSGLTTDELSTTMQQSIVLQEFEVSWPENSEVAARLQVIVETWETGK